MIKLGSRVKDNITGFTGIAVARTSHLHGCVQISILPEKLNEDGNQPEDIAIDEQRVELIEETSASDRYIATEPLFPCGSKVRDTVTGFTGVVLAYSHSLYDADLVNVIKPELDKDGQMQNSAWFHVPRLELIVAQKPPVSSHNSAPNGSTNETRLPRKPTPSRV